MATWGAHFRIAENILRKYTKLNKGIFAIGNIAPDCGIPDNNRTSFTPPKDISHFTISKEDFMVIKLDKFILKDTEFFSKYLTDLKINSLSSSQTFHFGYFNHLLTDNLWNYYIMKPLKEEYLNELRLDPKFIWKVKSDWYDLDKMYITENKDSLFWTDFLNAEYTEDFLDFLPREAILRQLEFIKKFYQISEEEYKRVLKKEYIYLKKEEMDKFIKDSTQIILDVLEQIIEKKYKLTGMTSFLDDIISWN
ncbi:MAG: zinc dependent phospholipase C family protein [Candidatus Thorarchaeota archaeon]